MLRKRRATIAMLKSLSVIVEVSKVWLADTALIKSDLGLGCSPSVEGQCLIKG
jgi:hypothetical protein